jgi:septum formation protein
MPPPSTDLPPLVLASASPRRAALLRKIGLVFQVHPSHAPEAHCHGLTAVELARINAVRKAAAVARRHSDRLVLGADTLVFRETALYGKPADLAAARQMLQELQGRTHSVVTAICLLHLRRGRRRVFTDTTTVTFRPLDAAAIRRYLAAVNPLDKAGAYAIQEQGDLIIQDICGSYSNVVGLPLERLEEELAAWAAPSPTFADFGRF